MIDIIHDWNPWWESGEDILKLKGIDRNEYLYPLMDLMDRRHIISISGIRRSGKTTLMYQMIHRLMLEIPSKNVCYINLDDERLAGSDDPLEGILREYIRTMAPDGRIFLFLDEVQSIPGWERWIKRYYDLNKDMKFVVSGSSSSLVSSDYSNLLSGRNITVKVDPLSFREYLKFQSIAPDKGTLENIWRENRRDEDVLIYHLESYIRTGGFPEIVTGGEDPTLLKQYFNDILYRDIIKRHKIRYPDKLELLAIYALRNHSNLLSLRRMGQASGLNPDTVNEYLGYLEQSYILFTSKHYSRSSLAKIRTNVPLKVYATDLGMARSLMLEPMETRGRCGENLVAKKVEKELGHCFYWREKMEVDVIVPEEKTAIQVSYGPIRENEAISLGSLPYNDFKKVMVTRDEFSLNEEMFKVPLWTYLLG